MQPNIPLERVRKPTRPIMPKESKKKGTNLREVRMCAGEVAKKLGQSNGNPLIRSSKTRGNRFVGGELRKKKPNGGIEKKAAK